MGGLEEDWRTTGVGMVRCRVERRTHSLGPEGSSRIAE